MTDTWTETDQDAYFNPGTEDTDQPPPPDEEIPAYHVIFEAPDYSSFLKHTQTSRGKEYETKVNSMLKAVTLAAFQSGHVTDAATILHYGPAFARKAGDLTDVSDSAAKAIDLLTTPDNPWVMFAISAIPFALQFIRNHETAVQQAGKTAKQNRQERRRMKREGLIPPKEKTGTPVTIKGPFGKKFTFRVHLPKPSGIIRAFRAQTYDPAELTHEVLKDQDLIKTLAKQGIVIKVVKHPDGQHNGR